MRRSDSHEPLQMMPWWVARWLASKAKAVMSVEQQGAYRNLLDMAWLEQDCMLSQDDEELRKLSGCDPEEWARCGPTVMLWFTEREGKFVNIPQKKEWQVAMKKRVIARRRAKKAGLTSGSARRSRVNSKFAVSSTHSELTANPPSPSQSQSTNGQRTTDADAPAPPPSAPPAEKVRVALEAIPWSKEAAELWQNAYNGQPGGKFFGGTKPLVRRYGWERVRPVLAAYLSETPVEYVNFGTLLAGFGEFEARSQGGGRVRDGPKGKQTASQVTVGAMEQIMREAGDDRSGGVLGRAERDRAPAPAGGGRGDPARLPPGAAGRDRRG